MEKKDFKNIKELIWGFVFSLSLNGAVLLLLILTSTYLVQQESEKTEDLVNASIESRLVSPEEFSALVFSSRQSVVENERAQKKISERRERAQYLSSFSQRVEQEMVNKFNGSYDKAFGAHAQKLPTLDRLGLSKGLSRAVSNTYTEVPASDIIRESSGEGGVSVDAVRENVIYGAHTLLNTDEFVHSSFFNRMKRQLAEIWIPGHQDFLGRTTYLRQGYYVTRAVITLDREGYVRGVDIEKKSGVEGLDAAAEAAIFKAEHFPNPPIEIFKGGKETFVDFTFIVNVEKKLFSLQVKPNDLRVR